MEFNLRASIYKGDISIQMVANKRIHILNFSIPMEDLSDDMVTQAVDKAIKASETGLPNTYTEASFINETFELIEQCIMKREEEERDILSKLNEAIDNGNFQTKAAQKGLIEDVNRFIEKGGVATKMRSLVRKANEANYARSLSMLIEDLPYSFYIHQVAGIKKKIEKAMKTAQKDAQRDPSETIKTIEAIKEVLSKTEEMVDLALEIKKLPVEKRKPKAERDEEVRVAAWKKLPKPTKAIVTSIIESSREGLEKRKELRITRYSEFANLYQAERSALSEKFSNRYTKEFRDELSALNYKFSELGGVALLNVIRGGVSEVVKAMEAEFNHEILKIEMNVLTWVRDIPVTSSECLELVSGVDSLEGSWKLFDGDSQYRLFSWRGIYAGGYNIQRLHIRVIHSMSDLIPNS